MKKLTSLQILMLMNLAVSSTNMHGSELLNMEDQDRTMQVEEVELTKDEQQRIDDTHEAAQLELQAAQNELATIEVLTDLAQSYPIVVEHIIENETDLEATFASIKRFISKKNKEIDKLSQEKVIAETEVARLAVELADAQAIFEKTTARQRIKHKRNHKYEQSIKDALMKAEQGVKLLSKKAVAITNESMQFISKTAKKSSKQFKKSKPNKIAHHKMKKLKKEAVQAEEMQQQLVQKLFDNAIDAPKNQENDQRRIMNNTSKELDEVVVQATSKKKRKKS